MDLPVNPWAGPSQVEPGALSVHYLACNSLTNDHQLGVQHNIEESSSLHLEKPALRRRRSEDAEDPRSRRSEEPDVQEHYPQIKRQAFIPEVFQ